MPGIFWLMYFLGVCNMKLRRPPPFPFTYTVSTPIGSGEVCGVTVQPSYQGSEKGKLLSLARFLVCEVLYFLVTGILQEMIYMYLL